MYRITVRVLPTQEFALLHHDIYFKFYLGISRYAASSFRSVTISNPYFIVSGKLGVTRINNYNVQGR